MQKEIDTSFQQGGTRNPEQQFSEVLTAEEVSATFFGGHVSYWTVLDMAKDASLSEQSRQRHASNSRSRCLMRSFLCLSS